MTERTRYRPRQKGMVVALNLRVMALTVRDPCTRQYHKLQVPGAPPLSWDEPGGAPDISPGSRLPCLGGVHELRPITIPSLLPRLLHMTGFKAGHQGAGGVKQLQMLSCNLPRVHVLQRLQEGLLSVAAFRTGHSGVSHLADGQPVALQLVAADQPIAAPRSADTPRLRVEDEMRFLLLGRHRHRCVA